MKGFMKPICILSILSFLCLPAIGQKPEVDVCSHSDYASQVHCLTNIHRVENGIRELRHSPKAQSVAKKRADFLCRAGTFSHDGWKDAIDFNYRKAGENLAQNFDTPQGAVKGLLLSKSHRAAIEGSYSSIGVATEYCGGRNITVQIFTQG